MSKKYYPSHSDGGATLAKIIIAFILLLAVIAGSVFTTGYLITGTANPIKWKQEITTPTPPNDDNTQGGGLIDVTENNGIKLTTARIAPEDFEEYGIDPQANTAYTLTATVNADAADKNVVWGVSWKNSSSSWASGKSIADYATVTPATEFGLTATLTVKQAFGEPINVKVASYIDTTVNAIAQVDYLKTVNAFSAQLNPALAADKTGRLYVGNTENTIAVRPTYGIGTVEGTVSQYTIKLYLSTTTRQRITDLMKSGTGTTNFTGREYADVTTNTGKFTFDLFKLVNGGGPSSTYDTARTLVNNYVYNNGATDTSTSMGQDCLFNKVIYTITYTYGQDYTKTVTYESTSGIYMNKKGLSKISVIDDINLDKDQIVVLPS